MDVYDKLIDLRITLSSMCDGFSIKDASKNIILSSKIKVLHLLSDRDMSQGELIECLAMAKSNLANLLKSMINGNLIDSYKNAGNSRNIYYKISSQGMSRLNEYRCILKEVFGCSCTCSSGRIEELIDELLMILKGKGNHD